MNADDRVADPTRGVTRDKPNRATETDAGTVFQAQARWIRELEADNLRLKREAHELRQSIKNIIEGEP